MTNITPEQLKKVAEYMGYKDVTLSHSKVHPPRYWGESGRRDKYTPHIKNSEQCLELMEKIILRAAYHIRGGLNDGETHIRDKDFNLIAKGKTINEAVTLAAIAYVEGLEK